MLPYSWDKWRLRNLRTYVFTKREERIVKTFLSGGKVDSMDIARIRHMVRSFSRLASDVQLYLRLREAISTVSA